MTHEPAQTRRCYANTLNDGIESGVRLCVHHRGQRYVDVRIGTRNPVDDALPPHADIQCVRRHLHIPTR